ncbi:hypothetical protein ATANTOWER_011902 [Ataeniobius toweri]|uniref:Secreted protein n=1 Tax=Ataeniobius toweri TaxID=208326 RepID=A0ABU7C9A2_9TELE|nr:hypothetical protein [Ataeniobius toweri]
MGRLPVSSCHLLAIICQFRIPVITFTGYKPSVFSHSLPDPSVIKSHLLFLNQCNVFCVLPLSRATGRSSRFIIFPQPNNKQNAKYRMVLNTCLL